MEEKIRALVVDDMEIIVKSIENDLRKDESIEIIGATNNGKEEYEKILELKPDIVITGNNMPEKNGIDVIEEINELNIEHKPEFILITGDSGARLRNKANKLGVFYILNKPINEKDIQNVINVYKESRKKKTDMIIKEVKRESFWMKIINFFKAR